MIALFTITVKFCDQKTLEVKTDGRFITNNFNHTFDNKAKSNSDN